MVKGFHLARSDAARYDADMVGKSPSGAVETALAVRCPYLFASLKVAVTISLIGSIVAELPTGGEAGIGRAAAGRLILRPDHPDLGGAAGRRRSLPPA